jgi:hypothetical protein
MINDVRRAKKFKNMQKQLKFVFHVYFNDVVTNCEKQLISVHAAVPSADDSGWPFDLESICVM